MLDRVVVLNAYGGSNREGPKVATWLRALSFTVAIVSELGWLSDDLSKAGRVYRNPKERPPDVGIVVSSRLSAAAFKALEWVGGMLSKFIRRPGSSKPRLWRDRWFVRVRIFKRVYYSFHGNALVAGKEHWLNNEGAEVQKEAMRKIKAMLLEDIEAGLRVRGGGDFNIDDDAAFPLSPTNMFQELGLAWRSDGRVMYGFWDPRTDELTEFRTLGRAPGADAHEGLLLVLKKRPRKGRSKRRKAA
jgi:hypothetical protein